MTANVQLTSNTLGLAIRNKQCLPRRLPPRSKAAPLHRPTNQNATGSYRSAIRDHNRSLPPLDAITHLAACLAKLPVPLE